jgi:hypothetical protein
VAQVVGPEFKFQYCKKRGKKKEKEREREWMELRRNIK